MTRIIPFPLRPLRVAEQSPAYGFPSPDEVDVTPGVDGWRVWLGDVVIAEFGNATRANRAAMKLRLALKGRAALENADEQ
jgi:hypothetical protein